MSLETLFDVVIVGAGLSGLSAAKCLNEFGLKVAVLEARDRVGGKTFTKHSSKFGGYVDVGGAYVGPTQNRILCLAEELGIETYKVYEQGKTLLQSRGKTTEIEAENFGNILNPLEYLDINNFFRTIDQMGAEIPSDAPWKAPHADIWDRMTLKEFINDVCYTRKGRNVAKWTANINLTCEPHEISLLWFLWYIKQCGGIQRVNNTANGAQERKFVGGSQQISQKMAEKLTGSVHLNEIVSVINQNGIKVEIKTISGKIWTSKYVILAISPMLQLKIHFEPPLPVEHQQLSQRMPMGSTMKAFLYYDDAFWRNKGYSGQLFVIEGDEHPTVWVFDDTKPDGSAPCLVLFVSADKCKKITNKTKEEREQILKNSLYKIFKMAEIYDSTHYEEFNWCTEHYSGGCYTSLSPPGLITTYGNCIRDSFGLIHFAGTETATKWSGYMDGAVEAGERSAREILYRMGKIKQFEINQDEPVSKFVKAMPCEWTFLERNLPSVRGLRNALVGLGFSLSAVAIVAKFRKIF